MWRHRQDSSVEPVIVRAHVHKRLTVSLCAEDTIIHGVQIRVWV